MKDFTNKAIWRDDAKTARFPPLDTDQVVDVAIVGGGITGITAAYYLAKAGLDVAVLEAMQVGYGTTGSSTGNLYATIDKQLHTVESKHNIQTMQAVATSRREAMEFIAQRVEEFQLDCDFQRVPFYFYAESPGENITEVVHEREAARKCGLGSSGDVPADFPFPIVGMSNTPNQAQFNALKYVQKLASTIKSPHCHIFEDTKVLKAEDGEPCILHTSRGTITARKVIIATHSPKGVYAIQTAMEAYREFGVAAKINGVLPPNGIYWHMQHKSHYSIRPYARDGENFIMAIGESFKVGTEENPEFRIQKIKDYLSQRFDVASFDYVWAAQNYKPADGLPFIGRSHGERNTFIATGFAGDGLVYGTLAAGIISDEIVGQPNQWAKIYSPTRFTPVASAEKVVSAAFDVASHFVKDHVFYSDVKAMQDIEPGEGKTIKIGGEKLAGYRDEEGTLHMVSAVCPHMGCIVHWNNAETSWDCPCHGSRFGTDGKVLEGPSYQNLARPK